MIQWEYKLFTVPQKSFKNSEDAERWFNEQGREGWELADINPTGEKAMFKRPLVTSRAN